MKELTDLEICKKIADIEGLMFDTGGRYARIEIWKDGKIFKYKKYNPLKDDALCFKLMKKHKIDLEFEYLEGGNVRADNSIEGKDPNMAICLAIIKAH